MSRGIVIANLLIIWLAACSGAPRPCTDQMGCLEIPPNRPIVIGVILADTEEYSLTSQNFFASIQQALTDKGELLGHPFELVKLGTNCSPEDTLSAALEFSTRPDLVAVIAPACLEAAQSSVPFLINAGIAFLSPVPNPAAAYTLTEQALAKIEQVSILQGDRSLYVPRIALLEAVNPLEIKTYRP
jgi:ABC-type branched-subunit amino acid transport system substrate-binding protein